MKPYVIRQGDYLAKLAHAMGFDAKKVWDDPKNAALKASREDPNMLQAGDVLFVPDAPKKRLPLEKETENAYVAKVPTVTVSVVVMEDDAPLANAVYTIEGLGDATERTTDAAGTVAFEAPVHVREVVVRFEASGAAMKIGVGDLDPATTDSGVRMRLAHLGHYGAKVEGAEQYAARDDAQLAAAVAAFQSSNGLPVTGTVDDVTRDALVAAHGS
ncbi:MAG TPA: peptidoglycan-binding protein [Minicystis sp.]|nr:peptidoglycan-binding protein [Minicystis sp.]